MVDLTIDRRGHSLSPIVLFQRTALAVFPVLPIGRDGTEIGLGVPHPASIGIVPGATTGFSWRITLRTGLACGVVVAFGVATPAAASARAA